MIEFDHYQSQNSGRAQNTYLVTLHGQLKGISTYKIIRLIPLMKKGGDKQSKFLNLETIDEHPQMKFFETSHWESHKWFHIAY